MDIYNKLFPYGNIYWNFHTAFHSKDGLKLDVCCLARQVLSHFWLPEQISSCHGDMAGAYFEYCSEMFVVIKTPTILTLCSSSMTSMHRWLLQDDTRSSRSCAECLRTSISLSLSIWHNWVSTTPSINSSWNQSGNRYYCWLWYYSCSVTTSMGHSFSLCMNKI